MVRCEALPYRQAGREGTAGEGQGMRATQGAGQDARPGAGRRPLGPALLAAGTLCLLAAGGLLWWHRGAAVFESIASAAIAWCL